MVWEIFLCECNWIWVKYLVFSTGIFIFLRSRNWPNSWHHPIICQMYSLCLACWICLLCLSDFGTHWHAVHLVTIGSIQLGGQRPNCSTWWIYLLCLSDFRDDWHTVHLVPMDPWEILLLPARKTWLGLEEESFSSWWCTHMDDEEGGG